MKLKLDENLSRHLKPALAVLGHDVMTVAIGSTGIGLSGTGMKRSESAAIFMFPLGLAGAAVGGIMGMNRTLYESPAAKTEKRK